MLNSLTIKNFRLFDEITVPKLGRVNLITGRNNSGKSSVLEALRIFAKRAKPSLLQEIASTHDEAAFTSKSDDLIDREFPYQHLFPDRQFPDSDTFEIYIGQAQGDEAISIRHHFYENVFEEVKDETTGEVVNRRRRVNVPKNSALATAVPEQLLAVQFRGVVTLIDLGDDVYSMRRSTAALDRGFPTDIPVSYIPTRFLSSDVLANQWDALLFTEYADHVKEALRIIDPSFEDLGFVKKDRETSSLRRSESERYALIKQANRNRGVPLNSMGDGMLRILQLTLGLFQARGGFLLIDEFENGLHHTVQEDVWSKLFILAEKLDVQIFATAHSDDAVKAFSRASHKTDQKGVLINLARSVLKDNFGQVVATIYDESQLDYIVTSGIEVRV
jgi:predicted ATP-dependent endonuclease of OLD family